MGPKSLNNDIVIEYRFLLEQAERSKARLINFKYMLVKDWGEDGFNKRLKEAEDQINDITNILKSAGIDVPKRQ